MQLKSSKKQLKLMHVDRKSISLIGMQLQLTCDIIAYHLVHFVFIWAIYKSQSGIDFFTGMHTVL